jgi:DNA-binding transcriptional LysR family regulator
MEFKQLEAFIQISKLQSFSKASESLFLTQPALSSQIHALEKEIGTQLFIRSTKKVFPTKAGVDFYQYAQKILALRDYALYDIGKYQRPYEGEINILASSVPAQYLLPPMLAEFNKVYPNIIFRLIQCDSREVYEELQQYQYDIGFVGTEIESPRYIIKPFCQDQLVVILPREMKYEGGTDIGNLKKFLSNKNFIMREAGSGTRMEVESFMAKNKISDQVLKTVAYFSSTQGIIEAVAQGMGVSFVSKFAAQVNERMELIQIVEIDSAQLYRNIYYLLKKDVILAPAQNVFVNYLQRYFQEAK